MDTRRDLIKQLRTRAALIRESAHRASTKADMDADMRTAWELEDEADKLEIEISDETSVLDAVIPIAKPIKPVEKREPSMMQTFEAYIKRRNLGAR